jgi:cysteine dioxygenase
MKKSTLPAFLEFLNHLSEKDFKSDPVDKYLTENQLCQEEFLPFIYFREETYGRNLVYKTDKYELLILTWLPQQRTPIHDHGGQRCWMLIQSGKLTFKNFKPLDESKPALSVVGSECHQAGEAVYIDDGMGVHSIANCTTKPAVSMHLYAGPVPRCRIYNEGSRTFDWVELGYFTSPEIYSPLAHAQT